MAFPPSRCGPPDPRGGFPPPPWFSSRSTGPPASQHRRYVRRSRLNFRLLPPVVTVHSFAGYPRPLPPLAAQFPELVGSNFADLNPKHGVVHHVETSGPPVFAKPRRLDAQKLAVAKEEFLKMEKAGIIRRSTSAWASPCTWCPSPTVAGGLVATTAV